MDPHNLKAELWLLGSRNFPHRKITLSSEHVKDLPDLLAGCQQLQPAFDIDALVQTIWRLGIRAVRHRYERRIPIHLDHFP